MRVVSWNCGGGIGKKIDKIYELGFDVAVIQECGSVQKYMPGFKNYLWTGEYDEKGLAIIWNDGHTVIDNHWENYSLREMISCNVDGKFDLIGAWAKPSTYVDEIFVYQRVQKNKLNENTIIMGDLNSNAIWDKGRKVRNHTQLVKELNEIGLCSAYHAITGDIQGKESKSTFFQYRDCNKGFHIDHCFVKRDRIVSYEIGDVDEWIDFSDHMPIILEIKDD